MQSDKSDTRSNRRSVLALMVALLMTFLTTDRPMFGQSPLNVTITSPSAGSSFSEPATITLGATATGGGSVIAHVDFYAGASLIGSATVAPFVVTWSNVPAGTYSVFADATTTLGMSARSPLVGVTIKGAPQTLPPGVSAALASLPLVQPASLSYQGAFRLPSITSGSTFAYGGTALAFNPSRGSLLMVGHDWNQQVAEIAVPGVRIGSQLGELSTAAVLQPFTDITEGHMGDVDPGNTVKIGGLLPYQGRVYATAYSYYDGDASQVLSHFVSGVDLNVPGDVLGPYRVGTVGAGFVSGYFGLVPNAWQAALGGPVLNGQCCLSIISRTSFGPAVSTMDPTQLGTVDPAPAAPLVYYPQSHPLDDWAATSAYFNGATQIRGVVFPEGTRSVLFFGRQGLGSFCYGDGNECHDPTDNSKGTHGFPYAYYVWAYDAVDLAAARSGQIAPWTVKPYAVWTLNFPFANGNGILNGAAYDAQTGRIYLSQAYGDNYGFPLIHVFALNSAPPPDLTPPTITGVPSNLIAEATSGAGAALPYASPLATDLVDGAVAVACAPASGSTFPLGTTTVSCTAADAHHNAATAGFTVTVRDTTPPNITQPANLAVEATGAAGAVVTFAPPTASDLVSGNVVVPCIPSSGATFPLGTTIVACTATDARANSSTKTFTVRVADTTPPVIVTPANMTVAPTGSSGAPVAFTVTASDTVAGAVTPACSPASGSTFAMGTTIVSCTAADGAGNSASRSFTVTVTLGYGFVGVQNLPPKAGQTFPRDGQIQMQWRLTVNGVVVDSTGSQPTITVRAPSGAVSTITPENPNGGGTFKPPTKANGYTWQFQWKQNGLKAGMYTVTIGSRLSQQTFGTYTFQRK